MFVHSLQVCKFARFAAGEHGGDDVVGPPRQVPGKAVDFIQDSERLRSQSTLSIDPLTIPFPLPTIRFDSTRFRKHSHRADVASCVPRRSSIVKALSEAVLRLGRSRVATRL